MMHAIDRVADVAYGEIVATIASASAGPGTRQNIDEFTVTTARGLELRRRRRRGEGDHHPQPGRAADPDARHRLRAACASRTRPRSRRPCARWSRRSAPTCPATGCKLCDVDGDLVTVLLEVEGAGDFLPPYAGNLDMMTAAAARVGEELAQRMLRDAAAERRRDARRRSSTRSLRDGMHSVRHAFTPAQVAAVAAGLDRGRGRRDRGLARRRRRRLLDPVRPLARTTTRELIAAAAGAVERARIAALLLPGIGTLEELKRGAARSAPRVARVATHCTEADIAEQHLEWAAANGMLAVGFLMMSHMLEPAALAEQARADGVLRRARSSTSSTRPARSCPRARPRASRRCARRSPRRSRSASTPTTTSAAASATRSRRSRPARRWLDGSLRGLGAGAGNAQLEVLAAALERSGHATGAELFPLMDVAEDVVAPLMPRAADHRPRRALDRLRRRLLVASCCTPSAPARSSASSRARS